jgi:hypothetical protein
MHNVFYKDTNINIFAGCAFIFCLSEHMFGNLYKFPSFVSEYCLLYADLIVFPLMFLVDCRLVVMMG